MVIRLDENYNAMTSTALLGYVGETNARPVSVEGMEIDGADRYVMTIDYGDGVQYEVDITGGQWTPTADILRSAQTVSCQIAAKKLSGDEYVLVKKSRIFRLRIGAAIVDTAIPSPDVAMDALDKIDAIGTQVAADRKAAETAAQTAQAVADSLPDDYVTAVGKIAENTAEIANVKLTDKELQRRVDALYSIGQGVTHKFETDSETAYAKTVPTGAKLMSVKSIGGRNLVFNQIVNPNNFRPSYTVNGVTITRVDGYKFVANGTATGGDAYFSDSFVPIKGHVYLEKSCPKGGSAETYRSYITGSNVVMDTNYGSGVIAPINVDTRVYIVPLMVKSGATVNNLVVYPQIYDLTAMFGSGNEPSTVEEFEAIFPNNYYPYNVGEIVSAGTEEVVEQGKNLFDYTDKTYHGANVNKVENGVIYTKGMTTTALNIPTIAENKYTLSFKVKSNAANQDGLRWSLQKGKNTSYAHDSSLIKSEVGYAANIEYQAVVTFVADTDYVSLCTIVGMIYDVQLENGDTATNYSPFYQTAYQIPEAIRNLPGYGWSAGTARNYVDYENKKYVQCVNSVDLGTLNWVMGGSTKTVFVASSQVYGQKLSNDSSSASNMLCSKYLAKSQDEVWSDVTAVGIAANATIDGIVYVADTIYTDATAFKQAMQDVMLYYELATPIVTDISDLLTDDFLRNIEVEAGGSVTFKNGNDNYHIPVPSEEEYIVKLSEIGGTT